MQEKASKPVQKPRSGSLEFALDSSGIEREGEDAVIRQMVCHPSCENDVALQSQKTNVNVGRTAFD